MQEYIIIPISRTWIHKKKLFRIIITVTKENFSLPRKGKRLERNIPQNHSSPFEVMEIRIEVFSLFLNKCSIVIAYYFYNKNLQYYNNEEKFQK